MTGRQPDQWIPTFTGRQFWPLDAHVDDVVVADIAHALSMQCRWGGQCRQFYSVAEHSVLLTRWVAQNGADATTQMCALLHDATEAYLVDMVRPVKQVMPSYCAAEDALWAVIAQKFDLPHVLPPLVKEADNRIRDDEAAQNMRGVAADWGLTGKPLGVALECWPPDVAQYTFLVTFAQISKCGGLVA